MVLLGERCGPSAAEPGGKGGGAGPDPVGAGGTGRGKTDRTGSAPSKVARAGGGAGGDTGFATAAGKLGEGDLCRTGAADGDTAAVGRADVLGGAMTCMDGGTGAGMYGGTGAFFADGIPKPSSEAVLLAIGVVSKPCVGERLAAGVAGSSSVMILRRLESSP